MFTFWQIYFPVLAAGVSSFVVAGGLHMGIGYYFHKKQERHQKEFEDKVAKGEVDPLEGMPMSGFLDRPTVSGQEGPKDGIGQYL